MKRSPMTYKISTCSVTRIKAVKELRCQTVRVDPPDRWPKRLEESSNRIETTPGFMKTGVVYRDSQPRSGVLFHYRNNRSLAHDNVLLNREESLLIFNHVTTAFWSIWALEQSIAKKEAPTIGQANARFQLRLARSCGFR